MLSRADRAEDPQWISYLDEAYVAAIAGHCFRTLGRGHQAARFARESLDMRPGYVRGRLFNTVLLAGAHILERKIDEACVVGHQALDLASKLSSARATVQIDALVRDLQPWRSHGAVRGLSERAALVAGQS